MKSERNSGGSTLVLNNGMSNKIFLHDWNCKIQPTSIFSELNPLYRHFSLMCPNSVLLLGYSHQEVPKKSFSDYLEQASLQLGIEKDKLLEELTLNYDGFCFEKPPLNMSFSPWSLLKFFNFPSKWFLTTNGTRAGG